MLRTTGYLSKFTLQNRPTFSTSILLNNQLRKKTKILKRKPLINTNEPTTNIQEEKKEDSISTSNDNNNENNERKLSNILKKLIKLREFERADRRVYEYLKENKPSSVVLYNQILSLYSEQGLVEKVLETISLMNKRKIAMDAFSCSILLSFVNLLLLLTVDNYLISILKKEWLMKPKIYGTLLNQS